jgi:hypothetical protein
MTAVAVLVCLVVITMIAGVLLKAGRAQRERVRAQERRLQAEWLAEAGIQRALARLAADSGYRGESWEIAARDLESPDAALIAIAVEPASEDPSRLRVRARADYPRDPPSRVRHTKQIVVEQAGRK